jgi:hypothetical protein
MCKTAVGRENERERESEKGKSLSNIAFHAAIKSNPR